MNWKPDCLSTSGAKAWRLNVSSDRDDERERDFAEKRMSRIWSRIFKIFTICKRIHEQDLQDLQDFQDFEVKRMSRISRISRIFTIIRE